MLSSSTQINQDAYVDYGQKSKKIEWHTELMGANSARVYMDIENGIVKRLSFTFPATVKIKNLLI